MLKEDAQKLAQEKLATARELIQESVALADEHRFTLESAYGDSERYFFKETTEEEAKSLPRSWQGLYEPTIVLQTRHEGCWIGSAEYGDC